MEATIPTVEFATSSGHKIVLKQFITGRENRQIQEAYLDSPDEMKQSEKINRITDLALTLVVVSVDGQTENIPSLVMDLNNDDTQEIIRKVNETTADKKKPLNTQTI